MVATTDKAKASAKARSSEAPDEVTPEDRQTPSDVLETQAELEQVRDILFGAQVREQKQGLSELATSVETRLEQLRGSTDQALQALSQRLDSDTKRKDQVLAEESDQRNRDVGALRDELGRLTTLIQEVRDTTTTSLAELRQSFEEQLGQLSDSVDTRHAEAMSALTDVRSSLGQGKADRAMLAELFQRLASDVTSDKVG